MGRQAGWAWKQAAAFWLRYEGTRLHTTPGDPGGTTKFGIAQRFNPDINIADLTWSAAQEILRSGYWKPNACEEIAESGCPKVAWSLFDYCGNGSARAARKHLQKVLGVAVDGRFGMETMTAIANRQDEDAEIAVRLVKERARRQIERTQTGKSNPRFLVGLTNRYIDLAAELSSARMEA